MNFETTDCERHGNNNTCPFAFTEASEVAQSYGCLPTPYEITRMRVEHGKTWACHAEPIKPCIGAIKHLKEKGLPYQVIDKNLVTEGEDWSVYLKGKVDE